MTKEQINRTFIEFVLKYLHPSFLLAVLMGLVFTAIEANETSVFMQWTVEKTGVTVGVWEGAMVLGALVIVYLRPAPLAALACSAPAVLLGLYLIWYGLETGELPGTVLVYLGWGYVGTLSMMVLLHSLGELVAENAALKIHNKPEG